MGVSIRRLATAAVLTVALTGGGLAPAPASALTWSSPVPVAHRHPVAVYGILGAISCPSARLCIATDNFGNVLSSTAPTTSAWSTASLVAAGVLTKPPGIFPSWLFGVACPSSRLCVGLSEQGQIVSSRDPAGPAAAWKAVKVRHLFGEGAGQVSCPSVALCVAAEGDIFTATDPGGRSGAWKFAGVAGRRVGGPSSVSCPSVKLCVAVSDAGGVFASTRPARGKKAWRSWRVERPSAPNYGFKAVSCPSTRLCIAVGGGARVAFSHHPAAGPRAWHRTSARIFASSLSCPTQHMCVAGIYGGVEVSTNPTAGRRAWHLVRTGTPNVPVTAVTCPSTRLCIAVGDHGELLSSTHPAGGARAWGWAATDGQNPLTAVSCPTVSECVTGGDTPASDGQGIGVPVLATTNDPAGGTGAWTLSDSVAAGRISCPSANLCVAGDGSGDIFTSPTPTGPAAGWSKAAVVAPELQCEGETCVDTYASITTLSCPDAGLCAGMAFDNATDHTSYLTSTNPAGGSAAWTVDGKPSFTAHGLACPSTTLCVGVGGAAIATTMTPTNGSSWAPATVDSAAGASLLDVACPSTALCVAVDDQGNILTTTSPTSPSSWNSTAADPGHPLESVACASANLCVALDDRGSVATSTDPATPGSWTVAAVDSGIDVFGQPLRIDAASCPSTQLCELVDSGGNVITGHP
jgi:hypothetical protein